MTVLSDNTICPAASVTGIHHLEIYVADCDEAARRYATWFGLTPIGRLADDERDCTSILLQRANVHLILTAPTGSDSRVAQHLHAHGESIKDIALCVTDIETILDRAVQYGVRPLPSTRTPFGAGHSMAIAACGDLVHTLIPSSDEAAVPTLAPWDPLCPIPDTAIDDIDHVALAVPAGELDTWVSFYVGALAFCETHQENVSTDYSAMRSRVVETANGAVRFPVMEPAQGRRRSQIDDYLLSHQGAGAQHLAFRSHNIVQSIGHMASAIDFLPTPDSYYDTLQARIQDPSLDVTALRRHGILIDRDATGLLLQVFSKPIGPRPTLFIELIERRGAAGFGSGNIRALYEAVERDRAVTDPAPL